MSETTTIVFALLLGAAVFCGVMALAFASGGYGKHYEEVARLNAEGYEEYKRTGNVPLGWM